MTLAMKASFPLSRSNARAQRQSLIVRSASTLAPAGQRDRTELGKSGLQVSSLGVGAWSWGDRSRYWQSNIDKPSNLTAYKALVASGIDFLDTAEVYGFGLSEEFVGEFMKETQTANQMVIGTKFAPLPWRQTPGSLVGACKKSLNRLGLQKTGLYIQHWPGFFLNAFSNDAHLEGLAQVAEQGLAQAVGVSNFKPERVRKAAAYLESRGTCLSSNQVQYSLLYRKPETNGVMEACRETGATLVAYSPMCQGLLTGKYSKDNKPSGPRARLFTEDRYRSVQVLLDCMRAVADDQGGKTLGQVAINWTMCKGAVPIPGAKNAKQVEEAAGALGWRLTDAQVAELDAVSGKVPPSTGAPFEAW